MLSSIDLLLPSLSGLIGEWYSLTEAARDGMPPHCTLLYPWRRSPLRQSDLTELAHVVGDFGPIHFVINDVGRFPGIALFLHPESSGAIEELMMTIWKAFPDSPPYEGTFGKDLAPVPHITVTKGTDEHLDDVERVMRERLGGRRLEMAVNEVSVSEEGLLPDGRWGVGHRVKLYGRS